MWTAGSPILNMNLSAKTGDARRSWLGRSQPTRPAYVQMEGLPDRGAPAVQDHDVGDARIHPTLPDRCSALMPATENLHGSGHGQLLASRISARSSSPSELGYSPSFEK